MSEVTRFDLVTNGRGFDRWQKMEAYPDGEWVKAEDYDALRAEVERLRAALVVAEDALANCYDVCEWPAQNGSKQLDALRTVRAAFPTSASQD